MDAPAQLRVGRDDTQFLHSHTRRHLLSVQNVSEMCPLIEPSGLSLVRALSGSNFCGQATSCRYCCAGFDHAAGAVVWLIVTVYTFLGLAIICDEYFCESLEKISTALKLSDDVAGATFMAAGSSAPELFTAVVTILITNSSEGLGTIVGSAIFNIMIIVGVTAIFAGATLKIWWYPLIRDSVAYFASIMMMVVVMADKRVMWWEALLLVLSYGAYIFLMSKNDAISMYILKRKASKASAVVAPHQTPTLENISTAAAELSADSGSTPYNSTIPPPPPVVSKAPTPPAVIESEHMHGMNPKLRPAFRATLNDATKKRRDAERSALVSTAIVSVMQVHKARVLLLNKLSHAHGGSGNTTRDIGSTFNMMSARHLNSNAADADAHHPLPHTQHPASGGSGGAASRPPTLAQCVEEGAGSAAVAAEEEEEEEPKTLMDKVLMVLSFPYMKLFAVTIPDCRKENWEGWYMGTFTGSIVWIGLLSFLMVDCAARAGCIMQIPPLVMGLVVIAAGTSVPDALSSVLVARMGQGNMAVANVLGSNVFNIFLGLGLPWLLKCVIDGEPVVLPADEDILSPIIVLLLYLAMFMVAIMLSGWELNKRVGYVFFVGHALFICYSLLTLLPNPVIKL